jgi:hypothetical protein
LDLFDSPMVDSTDDPDSPVSRAPDRPRFSGAKEDASLRPV